MIICSNDKFINPEINPSEKEKNMEIVKWGPKGSIVNKFRCLSENRRVK